MLEIARFQLGTLTFKYLGMLGKAQRLNKQHSRISKWPVKKLTYVINSMLLLLWQMFILPKNVMDKVNKFPGIFYETPREKAKS